MSDAAVANLATQLATVAALLIGFFSLWVKLKYGHDEAKKEAAITATKVNEVSRKVDDNTIITRAGTTAAAVSAKQAANTAADAKSVVENIDKKLNGGIDATVSTALSPIHASLVEHAAKDDKNMEDINTRFVEMSKYIHDRNHDILDAIAALSNKVALLTATTPPRSGK